MKDIIAKLLQGQELSQEERAKLEGFDPDSMAASARKKGEAERDEWKAKYDALAKESEEARAKQEALGKGKQTELQQLQERLAKLEQAKAEAEAEASKLRRSQRIEDILKASGIKFIDNVDPEFLRGAFARTFDEVDDLTDDTRVKELVGSFRAANKGLVLDTTGSGTGRQTQPGSGSGAKNPWSKDSFNLTQQVALERENPAEAARMKAAAQA